ncbi:MAG TPA: site-specific integrase [Candidatus Alistipes excrementigallinarum]|nr:site-specific integrase [Candidatus Alistipes excrementigallinarum]
MASISLKLDRRRATARGLYPIQFLLSSKGKVTTIGTGVNIRPEHWNGEVNKAVLPKCPNARAINESIESLFFKYTNTLRNLENDGKLVGKSVTEIKKLLVEVRSGSSKESLTDYFSRYAESRRTEKSREVYRYTLKTIRAFDNEEVPFEKVNVIWLKAFDAHLEKQGVGINTRAIHFRNLRAVFNSAINEDLIGLEYYPFRKFKIASSRKDKEALTEEQLQRLIAYDTPYPFRRTARDLFLLSFYMCGMNLVDLYHLDRLREGRAHFIRTKTSGKNINPVSILVQPEAAEIIARYAGAEHVLRFIEERATYDTFIHQVQRALRHIAKELGIEGLTFYWARYTWATLADKLGISEKEISKGLGHVDTSIAGKFYISYDWTKVDRANRTVLDYIKSLRTV